MATAASIHTECPVCHEGFTEPKVLPCTHLVCRKCVLSWLQKAGHHGGCPLCRAPIISDAQKGQGSFASQVDELPTDFATGIMAESEKMLSDSCPVCNWCDDAKATLFCLQCTVKLCNPCAKIHGKISLTQEHVTEKLSNLSAEKLVWHRPTPCGNHQHQGQQGKVAELYCSDHEELMCVLCASSKHRSCPIVQGIADVATVKRKDLKAYIKKMEKKEAAVTRKINKLDDQMVDSQPKFKAMRDEIKTAFDDLQSSLKTQRQKLNSEIQQREEAFLAERKSLKLDLENHGAALSAHRGTAERLVSGAPDGALLGTLGKLKSRLDALELQAEPEDSAGTTPGELHITSQEMETAKAAMASVGTLRDPIPPQATLEEEEAQENYRGAYVPGSIEDLYAHWGTYVPGSIEDPYAHWVTYQQEPIGNPYTYAVDAVTYQQEPIGNPYTYAVDANSVPVESIKNPDFSEVTSYSHEDGNWY